MNLKPQIAGIAGILTGLGLAGEFLFFMASGYSPEIFGDPIAALNFLRDRGTLLRLAVFFGALSVAARTLFVVGLASRLQAGTPWRAAATLYFGLLGGIGGLVALSFYAGTPMFIALAARDPAIAASAWSAFSIILSGFEGLGNFMLSLMLLAAGSAIITHKALPTGAGWAALLVTRWPHDRSTRVHHWHTASQPGFCSVLPHLDPCDHLRHLGRHRTVAK